MWSFWTSHNIDFQLVPSVFLNNSWIGSYVEHYELGLCENVITYNNKIRHEIVNSCQVYFRITFFSTTTVAHYNYV